VTVNGTTQRPAVNLSQQVLGSDGEEVGSISDSPLSARDCLAPGREPQLDDVGSAMVAGR
jgi:hypothetical protein